MAKSLQLTEKERKEGPLRPLWPRSSLLSVCLEPEAQRERVASLLAKGKA